MKIRCSTSQTMKPTEARAEQQPIVLKQWKYQSCPNQLNIGAGTKLDLQICRSREPLSVQTWIIAHFNQNKHFPISVSYNVYAKTQQKWLKQVPFSSSQLFHILTKILIQMVGHTLLLMVAPSLYGEPRTYNNICVTFRRSLS